MTRTALRILAIPLLAAAFLAGCHATSTPGTPPSAAAGVVEGKVFYLERIALPASTTMTVRLLDVTDSAKPIVIATDRQTIGVKNPAPFRLRFSPKAIREDRVYQVRAELNAKGQIWTHDLQQPVLTGNAPAYVEIRVSPRGS